MASIYLSSCAKEFALLKLYFDEKESNKYHKYFYLYLMESL